MIGAAVSASGGGRVARLAGANNTGASIASYAAVIKLDGDTVELESCGYEGAGGYVEQSVGAVYGIA